MQTTTPPGSRQLVDTPAPGASQLMERFLGKDPGAAEELYRRFAPRIFGIGMAILRNRAQAEDLVQDTFVNLWRRGMAFDPKRGSLDTLVILIARRLAIDVHRRRGTETRILSTLGGRWDPTPPPNPQEEAEGRDFTERAMRIMATLSAPQRRAVELACFGEKTSREIAEQEGIPLGTAKSRIRLGLINLRAALAPATQ
jgi:RNA polymerase sigma factor (sigma-70 family)